MSGETKILNEWFWGPHLPIKKGYDEEVAEKELFLEPKKVTRDGRKLIMKFYDNAKNGEYGEIVGGINDFYFEMSDRWNMKIDVIQHINNYRLISDYFAEHDKPLFVNKRSNKMETPVTYLLAAYEMLSICSKCADIDPYKGGGDAVFYEVASIILSNHRFLNGIYDDYDIEININDYKKDVDQWHLNSIINLVGAMCMNMYIAMDLARVGVAQMTHLNLNAEEIATKPEKETYKLVRHLYNSNRRNTIVLGPVARTIS